MSEEMFSPEILRLAAVFGKTPEETRDLVDRVVYQFNLTEPQ